MDLLVEDVAKLLQVSEETVSTWAEEGKVPAYKINGAIRFDPKEIESWVLEQKSGKIPGAYPFSESSTTAAGTSQFSLYRALHKGFVYSDVPGDTREEVIKQTMKRLSEELHLDAEGVTEMFLERERLMPTALNNGIAVPHTRDFLLSTHYDVVTLVYPQQPIDYQALDGQPVHSMFFLFACQDRRHLNLLAKLAHFSSLESNLEMLKSKPERSVFLEYVRTWEAKL